MIHTCCQQPTTTWREQGRGRENGGEEKEIEGGKGRAKAGGKGGTVGRERPAPETYTLTLDRPPPGGKYPIMSNARSARYLHADSGKTDKRKNEIFQWSIQLGTFCSTKLARYRRDRVPDDRIPFPEEWVIPLRAMELPKIAQRSLQLPGAVWPGIAVECTVLGMLNESAEGDKNLCKDPDVARSCVSVFQTRCTV